jgi:hypothetical protein
MEEKLRFVFEYERDEHSMTELCAVSIGISARDWLCVAAALPFARMESRAWRN